MPAKPTAPPRSQTRWTAGPNASATACAWSRTSTARPSGRWPSGSTASGSVWRCAAHQPADGADGEVEAAGGAGADGVPVGRAAGRGGGEVEEAAEGVKAGRATG